MRRLLSTLRWRDRGAVRYAMPRDENSPPAVVAPPLGGVLIQAGFVTQLDRSDRPGGGRFVVCPAASGA